MGVSRNITKMSLLTNFVDVGHKWEFIVYWRQCPMGTVHILRIMHWMAR